MRIRLALSTVRFFRYSLLGFETGDNEGTFPIQIGTGTEQGSPVVL